MVLDKGRAKAVAEAVSAMGADQDDLSAPIEVPIPAYFGPGTSVVLANLKNNVDMNGVPAVVASFDPERSRYEVRSQIDGLLYCVRPENVLIPKSKEATEQEVIDKAKKILSEGSYMSHKQANKEANAKPASLADPEGPQASNNKQVAEAADHQDADGRAAASGGYCQDEPSPSKTASSRGRGKAKGKGKGGYKRPSESSTTSKPRKRSPSIVRVRRSQSADAGASDGDESEEDDVPDETPADSAPAERLSEHNARAGTRGRPSRRQRSQSRGRVASSAGDDEADDVDENPGNDSTGIANDLPSTSGRKGRAQSRRRSKSAKGGSTEIEKGNEAIVAATPRPRAKSRSRKSVDKTQTPRQEQKAEEYHRDWV